MRPILPVTAGENIRNSDSQFECPTVRYFLLNVPMSCIYVASPVTTYDSLRYDRMITLARHSFPAAEILPARGRFADTGAWLCEWPSILRQIDGLIFFDDGQGVVGRRTYHEVCTAIATGIPALYLSDDGFFWRYPADMAFALLFDSVETWARVMPQTENRRQRGTADE